MSGTPRQKTEDFALKEPDNFFLFRMGLLFFLFDFLVAYMVLNKVLDVSFNTLGCVQTGRNIVGRQLPTLLDVTCCELRLFAHPGLLHVVARCCAKFETGHTFSPVQTDATLLGVVASVCCK